MDSPPADIWLLFSLPLCHLLFCLSKGRLLVPYQTLMNYEGVLSSGLDRNTSRCLPASVLKQLREERYRNPVKNTLFCRPLG